MASAPVFAIQYELLRSQDYVLITLSAPTGKVVDGRMETEEVQRVALTIPRFLELSASMGQMADNIRQTLGAGRTAPPSSAPRPAQARPPQASASDADDEPGLKGPADWVIRH
jgi:hypothetical protein